MTERLRALRTRATRIHYALLAFYLLWVGYNTVSALWPQRDAHPEQRTPAQSQATAAPAATPAPTQAEAPATAQAPAADERELSKVDAKLKSHDYRGALVLLDPLIAQHPLAAGLVLLRSQIRRQLGDSAGMRADLEQALQLDPTPSAKNALAWALVSSETAPSPAEQARALQLARAANSATDYENDAYLDTLAAVHGSGGDYLRAQFWQSMAIEHTNAASEAQLRANLLRLLQHKRVVDLPEPSR